MIGTEKGVVKARAFRRFGSERGKVDKRKSNGIERGTMGIDTRRWQRITKCWDRGRRRQRERRRAGGDRKGRR